ncbi:hypothetical protein EDC39_103133 [Geothermobacter ehrlichii]|uniref:Uncharacterized protein n=1 Tax=Geothermobacter ehrlichii TaxID=213224 RepID=A0A5D3WNR0_9BACT|nr:hypothetical protein EDC39_103133 [Geothermobacter ehrlichii]
MMIRVRYPDGETRMVRPPLLDHLIRTRKIVEFQREDGWASIRYVPDTAPARATNDGRPPCSEPNETLGKTTGKTTSRHRRFQITKTGRGTCVRYAPSSSHSPYQFSPSSSK